MNAKQQERAAAEARFRRAVSNAVPNAGLEAPHTAAQRELAGYVDNIVHKDGFTAGKLLALERLFLAIAKLNMGADPIPK